MIPTEYYIFLGTGLLLIGVVGVLTRRNMLIILMSIELILNAVNINLMAFSHYFKSVDGQVFAIFVITDAGSRSRGRAGLDHRAVQEQRNRERGRNRSVEVVIVGEVREPPLQRQQNA